MVAVNIRHVRRQVRRIISTAPIKLDFYRPTYEDDGMKGKIFVGNIKEGDNLTVLFDNTGHSNINIVVTDGSRAPETSNPKLYIEIPEKSEDTLYIPEINDFFTIGDRYYRFDEVTDILNLGVLWVVDLKLQEVSVNDR